MLVSWTRALSGDWSDPVVGRDMLLGCVVGVVFACLDVLAVLLPGRLGYAAEAPMAGLILNYLLGPTTFVAGVSYDLMTTGLFFPMASLFLFFLLRVTLRNDWGALALWVVVFPLVFSPAILTSEAPWVVVPLVVAANICGFML